MVRHVRFAQLHCTPGPLDGTINKRSAQRKDLKRSESNRKISVQSYVKKLWQDGPLEEQLTAQKN